MNKPIKNSVEILTGIKADDLEDLCEATYQAIVDGNGFGWVEPPARSVLEAFWKGVILVPERELFVARLDGRIVGSVQLVKPPRNNEAGAHAAEVTTFFVAPWARGLGLARDLLAKVETRARRLGFEQLDLSVRATQTAAVELYEQAGYQRWATKPRYAKVRGKYIDGYFYTKALHCAPRRAATRRGETERESAAPEKAS